MEEGSKNIHSFDSTFPHFLISSVQLRIFVQCCGKGTEHTMLYRHHFKLIQIPFKYEPLMRRMDLFMEIGGTLVSFTLAFLLLRSYTLLVCHRDKLENRNIHKQHHLNINNSKYFMCVLCYCVMYTQREPNSLRLLMCTWRHIPRQPVPNTGEGGRSNGETYWSRCN